MTTVLETGIMTKIQVDLISKPAKFTDEELVDEISQLRQYIKSLSNREKLLGEALKARHKNFDWLEPGDETVLIKGHQFNCVPIMVKQQRLDSERVKEEYGEGWWEDHCKELKFVQLRISVPKDSPIIK